MHIEPARVIVSLLLFALQLHGAKASFWDAIPVVSQLKSAVQASAGDPASALETQKNFVHAAPIVSQVYSAGQAIGGDQDGAEKTQLRFLHEFLEPLVENTPILGHAIGAAHLRAENKEEGQRAIRAASSATLIVVAGLVGAAAGAVMAGVSAISSCLFADYFITGLDSARHQEYRPYGAKLFLDNLAQNKASAGEIFDFVILLGVVFCVGVGAAYLVRKVTKTTGFKSCH